MKELLNEWRKFLNEDEGEDFHIVKMDPLGSQSYSVKMSNGEEFIAEFDKDLVVTYKSSGEEVKKEYLIWLLDL